MLLDTASLVSRGGLLFESLISRSQIPCAAGGPQSCTAANPSLQNSCCYNTPGGQLLQTQFWDTSPATGPSNSWTVHGLWPDNCDGTYQQYCAPDREYTNITAVLTAGAPSTLQYMQTYWKDQGGDDETFWEHEYNKHGTCISTLAPSCYRNYKPGDEVVDFFVTAVSLFQTLPSYDWLSQAGIVPSSSKTYTLAQIQAALSSNHGGHNVVVNCNSNNELDELWYQFNVFGSVVNGRFVPVDPVGSGSTCPSTGIKYLPKSGSSPAPSTTTTKPTGTATVAPTTTTAGPTPTGGAALSGKGYIYATTGSSSAGFLISAGKWYNTNGTPATFTATPNSDGVTFTLSTSKGTCAIQASDSSLVCGSSVSQGSAFGYDGDNLTYNGDAEFGANSVPSGTTQGTIYAAQEAVSLTLSWSAQ